MDARAAAALLDEFGKLPEEDQDNRGDAAGAAVLLDELGKLPARIERPQTFMEIGGYPHYENVCSNFLAFFFDPEGPHGLGSLFLDALLDSVSVTDREKDSGGNISVEREVSTAAGNRIDILIQSDSYAVLIENKIFAATDNPFDDYVAYLDNLVDENGVVYENKIKILLTLYPSGEGAEQGFINLTHADFVGAVRSALGHYVSAADARYVMLMLDFLNTLEHLGEGTRMNQEFVRLLAERSDEVNKFLQGISDIRGEMRGKARDLGKLIDVEPYQNVQQGDLGSTVPLYHALFHTVYKDEKSYIGIDTRISPSGWETQIFPRQGVARQEVEGLLNKLEISFEDEGRCIYPTRFDYEEDLSRIAPVVREVVKKISNSVG